MKIKVFAHLLSLNQYLEHKSDNFDGSYSRARQDQVEVEIDTNENHIYAGKVCGSVVVYRKKHIK